MHQSYNWDINFSLTVRNIPFEDEIKDLKCFVFFWIPDEYKGHCLLDACRHADPIKLKKYLSSDVVNFKHPYTGDTPLHCAVVSSSPKRKQTIEILIRRNPTLNERNKDFLTPLHVAADHSHYDAMDILLRHNAKVDALDGLGQTALHRYLFQDFFSLMPYIILMLYTMLFCSDVQERTKYNLAEFFCRST